MHESISWKQVRENTERTFAFMGPLGFNKILLFILTLFLIVLVSQMKLSTTILGLDNCLDAFFLAPY